MKRLSVSSAMRPLAEYIADLRDETVVLTEGSRPVAAIVPLKNVDRESLALSQHPEFLELIARSRADFAAGRIISLNEMKRRVLPKRAPNKRMQPPARKARRGGYGALGVTVPPPCPTRKRGGRAVSHRRH